MKITVSTKAKKSKEKDASKKACLCFRIRDKEVDIKDINRGMIDEEVSIKGVITDVAQSSSKTSYFLTVNDGEAQIQLIIFESQVAEIESKNLDIDSFKNHKVQVVGTVTQYNSEMELILSRGDSLRIVS